MEKLKIREATIEDLKLYFNWANEVSVRQNAINNETILLENHAKWFESRVTSETTFLYVFEQAETPVGQVRFDIHNDIAEIDYSIDKNFRGQGFGKKILSLGIEMFNQKILGKEIIGIVKSDNIPSVKVFEKLGFSLVEDKILGEESYKNYSLKIKTGGIMIVNSNPVYRELEAYFSGKYQAVVINNKNDLNVERLRILKPKYLFFPHWSYIIPRKIYNYYQCVVFHMTDLPYGRGGSPLQNLIIRGHQETKISALRVAKGMDTGDIYLKKPLSLLGTAEEVFLRAGKVICDMAEEIIATEPSPIAQRGEFAPFHRRKPEDGDISELDKLEKIHDFIRMLDAEGYPKAFLETEYLRLEFTRSSLKKDKVIADVRIIKK